MGAEGKKKTIEGEVVDKKTGPKKTKQFVSEKTVGLVVLVLVLIIAGYFAYDPLKKWLSGLWQEAEGGPTPATLSAEMEETNARLTHLEERLRALESRPEVELPANLGERLESLEDKIEALSAPAGQDGQENGGTLRFSELEAEITRLREDIENRPGPVSPSSLSFVQAVAALAPPFFQSRPFEGELERVRILVLEMPTLNQATLSEPLSVLSEFSRSGVPGLPELQNRFEKASIEALKAEGLGEDAGWWERTWARLKGLVVVRKTSGGDRTPLEITLDRARTALEMGNLKTAIDIISRLPGGEFAAFRPWLEKAGARQRAIEAYNRLVNFISAPAPGANGS